MFNSNQITHNYDQAPELRLEFIQQLFKSTEVLLEQVKLLENTIVELNNAVKHN